MLNVLRRRLQENYVCVQFQEANLIIESARGKASRADFTTSGSPPGAGGTDF